MADRTDTDMVNAVDLPNQYNPEPENFRKEQLMIYLLAHLRARPGNHPELMQAAKEMIAATRAEPGCTLYDLNVSITDPQPVHYRPMFAGFGKNVSRSTVTFVSQAAMDLGLRARLGVDKPMLAVENTCGGIGKRFMIHNDALPHVEVNPETYEVRADGVLLTCEPATVLPMAQRYFLF